MDSMTFSSAMATMDMPSAALSSAMPTGTGMSMPDMGDMDMSCKISMLWNWYTIDSCFLSKSWHVRSRGMFAGSCIGVVLLVMCLEFLRRLGREYDAFILRRALMRQIYLSGSSSSMPALLLPKEPDRQCQCPGSDETSSAPAPNNSYSQPESADNLITPVATPAPGGKIAAKDSTTLAAEPVEGTRRTVVDSATCTPYRPSITEQVVRAFLHMVQFAVAYIVMLLAMYFNGYIIICIFIGAFVGALVFSWEPISSSKENDATAVTKCCG